MIKVQGKINRSVLVACSGGVDSMAVVDFLKRNHRVTLLFFNHGTKDSHDALEFIEKYANNNGLKLEVGEISREKSNRESQEEYWRNERYKFFNVFNEPVITCHHLDDCVESWIFSSLHGKGKIIPYSNKNVIRPFRLNRKQHFIDWCKSKGVPWIEDTSNADTKYMRNFIRQELMPKALYVNPGLHKVIYKKINETYEREI